MDKEQSYRWLKFGGAGREEKITVVAAMDQALSTNYLRKNILKEETESKFQLRKEYG
jgi:hypothetical protein